MREVIETDADVALCEELSDVSLRDILTPLIRRKRVLLFTFLSVVGTVILLAALQGPVYTSHMTILVNRERLDPLMTPEATTQVLTTSNPIAPEEINSEVELLHSRDVLEEVAISNGFDQPATGWSLRRLLNPRETREDRIAQAVKRFVKAIKVEAVTKTNLIEVKYSASDPQRAYGVLKALGSLYTQKHVAVHRPAGSYDFFAGETERYRQALRQAEENLRKFAQHSHVALPDVLENSLAQQVALSVGQLHTAEQSLAADNERIRNDQQQIDRTPKRSPTVQTSTVADKLLDQLNVDLAAAQTRKADYLMRYAPGYPLVAETDREILSIQQEIAQAEKNRYVTESTDRDQTFEALRQDRARAEADRAGQEATIRETRRSIASIQGQLVDLDQQSIQHQDLLREVRVDEQSYLTYLAKMEQERISDALDLTRIANVAIAVPPAIPVLPIFGWPVIMLAAFTMALLLSVCVAYAVDYLDSSFQTPAQVADTLGIPLVITFPKRTA